MDNACTVYLKMSSCAYVLVSPVYNNGNHVVKITSYFKFFASDYSFYHNNFIIGVSIIPVLQIENKEKACEICQRSRTMHFLLLFKIKIFSKVADPFCCFTTCVKSIQSSTSSLITDNVRLVGFCKNDERGIFHCFRVICLD